MKVIKHKDRWYLQSETGYKEILLSTDAQLTKDGVQAIDDEFLEWWIKNPSCESVDVEHTYISRQLNKPTSKYYKIILPKEEPKQKTLEESLINDLNDKRVCKLTDMPEDMFYLYRKETARYLLEKYNISNK